VIDQIVTLRKRHCQQSDLSPSQLMLFIYCFIHEVKILQPVDAIFLDSDWLTTNIYWSYYWSESVYGRLFFAVYVGLTTGTYVIKTKRGSFDPINKFKHVWLTTGTNMLSRLREEGFDPISKFKHVWLTTGTYVIKTKRGRFWSN
jgi:hypothetical protein